MKLDKLRGLGPWFAFATPVFFLASVALFVSLVGSITLTSDGKPITPDWFPWVASLLVLLLALFTLSGLVVALDLEWIEHPRTHTGLTYIGLGAMAVSSLAFLLVLVQTAFFQSAPITVSAFFWVAGLGVYMVVMNWVGMRAQLWGQVFGVVGIVGGACWLLVGVSLVWLSFLGVVILAAIPIYLAWLVLLGLKLRAPSSTKAPAAG
jgi:hypothetical protein